MFLSDGGNIPLMVQGDQFTTHKWKEVNFDTHMFFGLKPADFEVVDSGSTVPLTYACVRNP
jgi:serine/threonine-protein kinase